MVLPNQPSLTQTGKVLSFDGTYYGVKCDAGHYPLFLLPNKMNGANVGDTVRVGYYTTPSSGYWSVMEIK